MELDKKFNENYKKDKIAYQKVAKLEADLETIKSAMKLAVRKKEDAEIKKNRAIEDKDKDLQKQAEEEIKTEEENIEKLTELVKGIEEKLNKAKEKVDAYIEKLKEDPEFETQVNLILEKRYNRKRKQAIKEQQQVKLIIDLCEKHPSLGNNLKGLIRAKEELDKLSEESKNLVLPKDEARIKEIKDIEIPSIASKRQKNETAFMGFCLKNGIEIDEQFLHKLTDEKSYAHNKSTGDILLTKTLKTISKGYDKKIDLYEKSIEKIPNAKVYREVNQEFTNNQYSEENNKEVQPSPLAPTPKHKWWEFRKRFKDWNERRKVAKEQKEIEKEQEERMDRESEPNKFRNAYKYDVVKDYVERREKEIEKEVKTKKEDKDRDTEGEER